ncbi:MAG: ATP-binding cassette domain-containing protein [Methylococcales symbiont of Iophon sp. n. MRB-2018]|nr:MAG: ATP-binding cassette domain-containing protein [Methylococcales symbiont of Iophon sp. n. MRB-2018]
MMYAYQLRNIQYSYGKTLALSLSELNIKAGEITALIGPNGCGKSTLLNLLALLEKTQSGQLRCFPQTVTKQPIYNLRKRIALLPQKPYMLRGSVFNNLNLTLKFHKIKQESRLDLIHSTLEKLNIIELIHQQAKTLSAGELQKIALARAIITDPDILLMDEPFSYLDYSSEQTLESFIGNYVKESSKTLIFSTHNRLQGIAIADEVVSLVKGKSVATPLINVFHGTVNMQLFNTGNIQILLPECKKDYQHVSIDPREIVLSKELIKSSMRNQFQGKVLAITDEANKIRMTVLAGELFQVLITYQALKDLNVSLGDILWVNFKSNAVIAF